MACKFPLASPARPVIIPRMEPAPQNSLISRLSHTHEQVLNWLVANPERSQRECADHFGYTQAWLSRLIHSDLFQARLKERQETVFLHVAQDIPAKLRGLADIAIERVAELVGETENPDILVDVFDKTLHRLGYAPASARNPAPANMIQNNVILVSQEDLAIARDVVISGATLENPSPQLTLGEVQSIPSPGLEVSLAPGPEKAGG